MYFFGGRERRTYYQIARDLRTRGGADDLGRRVKFVQTFGGDDRPLAEDCLDPEFVKSSDDCDTPDHVSKSVVGHAQGGGMKERPYRARAFVCQTSAKAAHESAEPSPLSRHEPP